jgi:hypothetical protein
MVRSSLVAAIVALAAVLCYLRFAWAKEERRSIIAAAQQVAGDDRSIACFSRSLLQCGLKTVRGRHLSSGVRPLRNTSYAGNLQSEIPLDTRATHDCNATPSGDQIAPWGYFDDEDLFYRPLVLYRRCAFGVDLGSLHISSPLGFAAPGQLLLLFIDV